MKRLPRSSVSSDIDVFQGMMLGMLLFPMTAHAQDVDYSIPCAPEVENRSGLLTREGDVGMWLHIEIARCLLGRVAVLPELQAQLRTFEERRRASVALQASLTRRGDLAVQEAETAREALTAATRALRRAQEDLATERNLRWLWVTGAVVVVIVLEVVAIWVFSQVRITVI